MNLTENEFKVLIHAGSFVDYNQLSRGVYATHTPILFSFDTTIEMLSKRAKMAKDMNGNLFVSERYFQNLNYCELITVTLTPSK